MMLGGSELLMGLSLLPGGELREALVASVGVGVALWALGSRIASDDDAFSATLAGILVPLGFVAVRRLGFSAERNVVESLAALVAGAGVGGLARVMDDAALPKSARVGRAFAFAWPLLGLLAAPWHTPWTVCLLMLAQSAHFAVVSRDPAVKRRAAVLSTAAFNAAMAAGFFATGAHTAEYLLIPFGISLLTLLKVFEGDVTDSTRVKLRAVAVSIVYGAAAVRPLMFDTPGAMWLCVGLCVVGIAFGVVVRIRSYVYMGTAFIVTTVIANLIRYGVREPRIGALFLSGLGLAVVAFMVLVTTRRAELLERYKHARSMLENWDG